MVAYCFKQAQKKFKNDGYFAADFGQVTKVLVILLVRDKSKNSHFAGFGHAIHN